MKKITPIIFLLALLYANIGFTQRKSTSHLAKTPPMGFITWNLFEGNISEEIVKSLADAMAANGMKEAGYEYIILDDLWHGERDKNGRIQPDPKKFPNGMKVVADYVHAKGFKFGIYTDIAPTTCAGKPGSLDYEIQDAQTYAAWGVDYVKVDYCHSPEDIQIAIKRYSKFEKAIRATGRDMVYAVCEWGQRAPWTWAQQIGGQLWRTTWDLRDTWEHGKYANQYNGIMEVLDRQVGLEKYAGPGHWNDPDMLVIGLKGRGSSSSNSGAKGCTEVEYEAQMGLWSLLSAPLLVTCDIRNIEADTKRILTNKEVIAIDQDKLGYQGIRIAKKGSSEIWAKPLANGDYAVGLLNRDGDKSVKIKVNFNELSLSKNRADWVEKAKFDPRPFGAKKAKIRDLWKHEDLGEFENSAEFEVAPHQCMMLRLTK